MRTSKINRETAETKISLKLNIDGTGKAKIDTGCGFLNHMLTLFASHGLFDIELECVGDTEVDYHHTAEDIAICIGQAFYNALGDKKGIVRYGNIALPMDEALILSAVDFSGRGCLGYGLDIPTEKVGDFDTELCEEFWLGFVREAKCSLHFQQLAGVNSHHIIEGAFKAAARAMRMAAAIDEKCADKIPSTKGLL